MTFIPTSTLQKFGMCIPVFGAYFFMDDKMPLGDSNIVDVAWAVAKIFDMSEDKLSETCKKILDSEPDLREKIVREARLITGCKAVNGLLTTVISAVALFALQGVIATTAAVLFGVVGSLALLTAGFAGIEIYHMNAYLQTPQTAANPS